MTQLRLSIFPDLLAVCRLAPDAPWPEWARGAFTCVARTPEELSVVCDDAAVPEGVQAERGWRAVKVEGPIPFELTGIAAALVSPLAEARISVFLMSTYDTDYLLVRDAAFARALEVLRAAGHEMR